MLEITQSLAGLQEIASDIEEVRISEGIEVYLSLPDPHPEFTIIVGRESSVSLVCMSPNAELFHRSEVHAHAHMHWYNVSNGESETNHSLTSELVGEDARSDIDWIVQGKESQKRSVFVRNRFLAPRGSGEVVIRGVAEDTSKLIVDGMIDIGAEGGGTDTYLTEEVLMLDSTAKVDAIPGLEIKTNDVKASHSATVHRITPEDLFYFAARGIEKEEARRMYIDGFTMGVFERIDHEELKSAILSSLQSPEKLLYPEKTC